MVAAVVVVVDIIWEIVVTKLERYAFIQHLSYFMLWRWKNDI